jgi:transcriptional regulator with XRE-family HTH domain
MSTTRPKIVGNFLRRKRESLNLSQRALGLLFDPPVTTQFISNVERGVTPLPPAHVPTLAKALQVSDSELLGLLEKEYTQKLSGRLGLAQDVPPPSPDFDFIQSVYQAYQGADAETRQAFEGLCQTMLNLNLSLGRSPEVSQSASAVALSAAESIAVPNQQS